MPVDDERPASGTDPLADVRKLTDSRTLRALTHPVRIALIEALLLGGAMTATEVGERIGESPTTCSFHLRQLAKYGFVEEAGGGKGRSRPWRLTSVGMQFATAHDDPETEMAAGALVRMLRERQFGRYLTWLETNKNFPREWRDAAGSSESLIYLTAGELESSTRRCWPCCCPGSGSGSPTPPAARRTRCRSRSSCWPTRSACPRPVTSRPMRRPPMIPPAANRPNECAPPRRRT